MDTLKDVLLVFTVLLLVYVLYQRLLRVLGKKEKSSHYAAVGESLEWKGKTLSMTMEVAKPMPLEVAVRNPQGHTLLREPDRNLEKGTHIVAIDCNSLSVGRYYVWLKTPSQEYSRYFEITE